MEGAAEPGGRELAAGARVELLRHVVPALVGKEGVIHSWSDQLSKWYVNVNGQTLALPSDGLKLIEDVPVSNCRSSAASETGLSIPDEHRRGSFEYLDGHAAQHGTIHIEVVFEDRAALTQRRQRMQAALHARISPDEPVKTERISAVQSNGKPFDDSDNIAFPVTVKASFVRTQKEDPSDLGVAPRQQLSAPTRPSRGQLVLAAYNGGWYRADVLRVTGERCDVAWRRPNAEQWGDAQYSSQFLCSTGADETLHGDGLLWASQIKLLD